MILADKIISLRKKYGWSQEELAEKMKVSRQSVSKWEGAISIPDLNKIIKLGEIFGVSTDYLLKDEIEEIEGTTEDKEEGVKKVNLKEATEYLEQKIARSKVIAKGVLLCIYSIIPLLFFEGSVEGGEMGISEEVAASVGLACLFVMVAIGVVMFISSSHVGKKLEVFESEKFELEYGVESIIKQKAEEYSVVYVRNISISVSMFILSAVPLILSGVFGAADMIAIMMVVVLIFIAGAGVFLIISTTATNEAYDCLLREGEFSSEVVEKNKNEEKIGAFYWPLVTAVYLGWSLLTMDWHITWIVWPVAGLVFAALTGLVNLVKS